jgi:hypothetical protein
MNSKNSKSPTKLFCAMFLAGCFASQAYCQETESQRAPNVASTPTSLSDNVLIILDDSGSMRERMQRDRITRMDAAKAALTRVIEQIKPQTNVGILLLNGARRNKNWLVPFGPLDKPEALRRIAVLQPGGGTPLGEAMRVGADELLTLRSKNFYGTYRLVVVTDGEASDPQLLQQFLPDVLSRGILVDAIGVDMQEDHSLATKVHSYRRANDIESLSNAIQEILAEQPQKDQANSEADFALLDALGDVDVSEVLKALSKPNNEPITGILSNGSNTFGNSSSSGAGTINPTTGFATPAQTNPTVPGHTSTQTATSWLSQILGTICSCFVPLILIFLFLAAFLSSNKSGRPTRHK